MSEARVLISPARLRSAPAYIAFLMLAIGMISFVDNNAFSTLTNALGIRTPVSSLYIEIAIVPAMMALASLRAWKDRTLKTVMYLSLIAYLPAVIGLSRIDLLKAAGYSFNFGALSGGLSPAVIAVFGILLACGGLSLRSFAHSKTARDSFMQRGADPDEVDLALYRHARLETKIIGAAAAAVLAIMIGVPVLELALMWVLQSAKFAYVLAGLGAALVLALVIVFYMRGIKR